MSDNPVTPNPESQPPAEAQTTDHMIPKSRFDEVNTRYRETLDRLEKLEQSQTQQREKELSEQNRFKELYEEAQARLTALDAVQTQAKRYREQLEATNQARIERIAENKRTLIPDYDDPVKIGAWLDLNEAELLGSQKPPPPNLDGGAGRLGDKDLTANLSPQEIAIAKAAGISLDDYVKAKANVRKPLE